MRVHISAKLIFKDGKILGVMSGLSLGTRVSNLKSVALTVLELLAFYSHDRPLRTDTQKDTHTSNVHIHSGRLNKSP